MELIDIFRFLIVLILPGFLGALVFSLAARLKTEINIYVALILDLITFTAMMTGLFLFKDTYRMSVLIDNFSYLLYMIKYILISTAVSVGLGSIFGTIRRIFFWIRK